MGDILTYEDLEKRIKALESKLNVGVAPSPVASSQLSATSKEERANSKIIDSSSLIVDRTTNNKQQIANSELQLLQNSARGFLELRNEADIFEYIAGYLSKFCEDSIVIINSFDNSTYSLITKAIAENSKFINENGHGIINKLKELYNEKAGQDLIGASKELSEHLTIDLLKAKLIKAEGGINDIVFNMIPKANSLEIEQILNIKSTYIIGFAGKGEIYGYAVILSGKHEINNTEIIETFAGQCALAIQRRQFEESLKESKEYHSVTLKCVGDGVITTNKTGQIVYINPIAEQLTGWQYDSAKGRLLKDVFKIGDSSSLIVDRTTNNEQRTIKLISKSGKEYLIAYNASQISKDNSEVIGEIIAFRDITEQKKYEENIKNNEGKYKQLISDVPLALISCDKEGNIEFANDYMVQLLGAPSAEETKSINLYTHKPLIKAGVPDKIKECINTGNTITLEFSYYTQWGKSIYIKANFIALKHSNNETYGVLISAQDLTLSKVQETELIEAKQRAEEADKLKSAFLANMSHEIRSPMNAIIGFSSLLSDEKLSKKDRDDFVNLINISCNNLSNLLNDIIDIAKIEAGQIKINKVEFNVVALLDETYNLYKGNKRSEDKTNIEFKLNKSNIPDTLSMISDPFRLKQILINLIGNAFKFTEEGFIEFGVKIKDENTLIFYVQDTGIGIKPHELLMIFDRFRQSENNDVTKHTGTGLGLTISKNLTKLLGGVMWVESEYKHGSTFYFTLPCKTAEPKPQVKEIQPEIKEEINWSDKTILVVEDIEINYILIKEYLKKTKAKILLARDGQEAIEMCKDNENIDLILMDIQLPVVNGYVATRIIKEFRPYLPIIAETAYAMASEKHEILKAGCDNYLAKPLKSDELINVVNKYINIRKNYQT